MERPVRLALAVVAALVCLVALRWSTRSGSGFAAPHREPVAASRLAAASSPAGGDEGAHERTRTPARVLATSVATRVEATRAVFASHDGAEAHLPPLDLEDESPLFELRRAFASEPIDADETQSQRSWIESLFDASDVQTLYNDLQCSSQLCRAELGFENVWRFRDLGRISLPEDFSHLTSRLVRRADRPGLCVLVYWAVGDRDLTTFVELEPLPADGR